MTATTVVSRWSAPLALFALLLALSGCASTPPTPDALTQAAAQHLWTGRMSLHIESEPPQHFSGSFELSGQPDAGALKLLSPFGQTWGIAEWDTSSARLQRGDDTYVYPDTDSLTRELTGTPLPLATLFDWLQGKDTAQAGWSVDFSQYPQGKLTAHRQQPLPPAHLRLVIQ